MKYRPDRYINDEMIGLVLLSHISTMIETQKRLRATGTTCTLRHREVYMTDIAPTISAMLNIQMPSGNVGKALVELVK